MIYYMRAIYGRMLVEWACEEGTERIVRNGRHKHPKFQQLEIMQNSWSRCRELLIYWSQYFSKTNKAGEVASESGFVQVLSSICEEFKAKPSKGKKRKSGEVQEQETDDEESKQSGKSPPKKANSKKPKKSKNKASQIPQIPTSVGTALETSQTTPKEPKRKRRTPLSNVTNTLTAWG